MSEVLWWTKENWYEAKTIPLFNFMVSPRQIIFVLGFGVLGLIVSAFIPIYYVKIGAVLLMVVIGAVLASLPSRIVPFELALLYHYRPEMRQPRKTPKAEEVVKDEVLMGTGVPFAVTGELKVKEQTEAVLYVDDAETARAIVTPTNPKYRLYYYPEEKGVHELSLKVNSETLKKVKVKVE